MNTSGTSGTDIIISSKGHEDIKFVSFDVSKWPLETEVLDCG